MKYPVWFIRFLFGSWMVVNGMNHFAPLFPQPMGSKPLSHELIVALLDSHLFDLVKAVELVAGLSVLSGFYAPLAVILCLPVSFCVFYWDGPLEGMTSRAAQMGDSVIICNLILCAAYVKSYKSMFAFKSTPRNLGASGGAHAQPAGA